MRAKLRKWWPLLKAILTVAILVAIGRQFVRDLRSPELWQQSLRPGWLVLSGILYLLALGTSALYWYELLRALGQRPSFAAAIRAHYIGQMGKYLPGKAWALVVRSNIVRGPACRVSVAIVTSFYEVLTTMAGGALLAAVLFACLAPETVSDIDWTSLRHLLTMRSPQDTLVDRKVLVLLALCLFVPIALPILPPIFNRIVYRLARPFRELDAAPLPPVRFRLLLGGLVVTSGCWFLMGASLWAMLHAVMASPLPWTWDGWLRATGSMALAYVAGFIILLVPSGLGVREFFLTLLLVPQLLPYVRGGEVEARAVVVLAVIALRLVWTASELIVVGSVYWLEPRHATIMARPQSVE
jgi:uncharacterized membrane protein YbhN (UPF0104 family)